MEKIADKIRYGCIYKDTKPEYTINKIRSILEELGIFLIEAEWHNNVDRLYSCRVQIKGTEVGTNGKGVSQEYALASAYAEFIERLQNQAIFFTIQMNPNVLIKHGFFFDPTEKIYLSEDTPSLPEDFKKAKLHNNDISLYHYLINHKESFSKVYRSRVSVPFYNLNKDKIDYLDINLMHRKYGSNGMASGNSPEEAISQAISEVFERYIERKAYWENIAPPTIPMEYIAQKAPQQYEIIEHLKQTKNIEIIVKDCSLNQGLPVIGVIMIFKDTNSFSVRFGGEPIWQIALERCLTEMFQGRYLNQYKGTKPLDISPKNNKLDSYKDFKRIVCFGIGQYPNSFFINNPDYPFNGFPDRKIKNNKDKLQFQINLINNLGYNMFIRDVSFLGFNTFFVIIPGLSEVEEFLEERVGEKEKRNLSKIRSLSGLNNLSNNELYQLAEVLENFYLAKTDQSENILFSEFVGLPVSDRIPWNHMTLEYILSAIYFKLGEYQKSRDNFCKYLDYVIDITKKTDLNVDFEYHFVVKQFLGLYSLYPDDLEKIKRILIVLFNDKIVNDVLNDFSKKDDIFKYIPLPNMWNCDTCTVKEYCKYNAIEDIYLAIKDKIKENPIDQMHLKNILK